MRTIRLLEELDELELSDLVPLFQPIQAHAGEHLFSQNAPADGAYFLTSGRVEALYALPGGDEIVVATLGPGSMVGEMALLEAATRTAKVRVIEDMTGLYLARRYFQAATRQPSATAFKMLRALTRLLSERQRALHRRIVALATTDRLAPFRASSSLACGNDMGRGNCTFDYQSFLGLLPFFRLFSRSETTELAARMTVLEAERNQVVCEAGSPRTACFVVVRGALEAGLVRERCWHPLALVGPGRLCGHHAFIAQADHGATVRAREPSVLLVIGPQLFEELFTSPSHLGLKFLEALHECQLFELRQADNQLARLISREQIDAASAPRC